MRKKKRTAMAAAVVMAGILSVFPAQAAGIDEQQIIESKEQTTIQNELEEYSISKQQIEIPELLSIEGREMKLGEVLSLSGGGTAELVREEGTQRLVLNLKDAVIGTKDEPIAINTMESLKIRIQGNCTINGEHAIVYLGSDQCQVTLEKVENTNALLTVNAKNSLVLRTSKLFNYCDLQINVCAEGLYKRFYLASDNIENYGNLSLKIQNETEESFGMVSCKTIQNYGTFHMQEAEGKDEYDLIIEKLVSEEGSRFTVKDGVEMEMLEMSGGVVEAEDSNVALRIFETFEMTGGEIQAVGGEVGIFCGNNMSSKQIPVSITNGKIDAEAKNDTGRGMKVMNCNLSIQGGEYRMKGGTDYFGALHNADQLAGLSLYGTEAVIGGCKLEASGGIGIAHDSSLRGGDLTIASGAEISTKGTLAGIDVYSANLVLQGGTIRAEVNGEEESWAPIVAGDMWFDTTTEEEQGKLGHILVADGMTFVNGAKGASIQERVLETPNESGTIYRYFEFLGNADSSIQMKDSADSYIHYEYKNIPLSVEITDSHDHVYSGEGEIIKQATEQTEGVIRYYCDTCGGYRDEVIPKLSGSTSDQEDNGAKTEVSKKSKTSENPQTGDSTFPAMWIMLGSIAVVTGVIADKCRKMSK